MSGRGVDGRKKSSVCEQQSNCEAQRSQLDLLTSEMAAAPKIELFIKVSAVSIIISNGEANHVTMKIRDPAARNRRFPGTLHHCNTPVYCLTLLFILDLRHLSVIQTFSLTIICLSCVAFSFFFYFERAKLSEVI